MIITKELKTLQDFQDLKKGDAVAVEWKRDVQKNKKVKTRFACYEIVSNLADQTEIILQKSCNIYFNYTMLLDPKTHGVSNAKSVMLISVEGD